MITTRTNTFFRRGMNGFFPPNGEGEESGASGRFSQLDGEEPY